MGQPAQVFGCELRRAVDVFRARNDLLGDPGRGPAWRRRQRIAKSAGRAGEDERRHTGVASGLEQVQRAGDVGVDKIAPRMGGDMRLVQRRGMQDGIDARHVFRDEFVIHDRSGELRERAGLHVDRNDLRVPGTQDPHQRFTKMPGTAGDQILHAPAFAMFRCRRQSECVVAPARRHARRRAALIPTTRRVTSPSLCIPPTGRRPCPSLRGNPSPRASCVPPRRGGWRLRYSACLCRSARTSAQRS